MTTTITPRLLRFKDAPRYLGMCAREFNQTVRPHVNEVVIGRQGIAFDRYELDEWVSRYMAEQAVDKPAINQEHVACSERRHVMKGESRTWHAKQSAASIKGRASGTLTKSSTVSDFEKALEQARGKKQSAT